MKTNNRKIKILFFIFDLGGGGAEKVLVNLVNNLNADKYDITVRTIFGGGVNVHNLKPHIKYSSFFKIKPFKGSVFLQKFFTPKFLYKIFITGYYDIEIAFMHHSPTRIISGSKNVKKFAWVHGCNISTSSYRNYAEFIKCYNSYENIAFVAKKAQESFISQHTLLKKSKVVYNVMDYENIKMLKNLKLDILLKSNELNICTVGRLSEEKGYKRLINCFVKLKKEGISNWHLYILGDGQEKPILENIIKNNDLESQISLLGFQSNPYKYVSKMDLFVCSSYTEAFSTAVSESIILGIPVLTTECSGMKEIIGETEAGMIVPNSEEGLFEGLKLILSNRKRLSQMKESAKYRSSFFSTSRAVSEFEKFIGTSNS